MAHDESWQKIFDDNHILEHDFEKSYYSLSAQQIKRSVQDFTKTSEKEVRVLCKQDTRRSRPKVFIDNGLFILPTKNGYYAICKGEGYIDVPTIKSEIENYNSKLDFHLDTSEVGNSEMQYLDMAYNSSLIRTFMDDSSLVLTIRGRKYTPDFSFCVGNIKIPVSGVQTEVDAGYEGDAKDTIIRQLFYPFRQWKFYTQKEVVPLFFERDSISGTYNIWQYTFDDENNYNSIRLVKSKRYKIVGLN